MRPAQSHCHPLIKKFGQSCVRSSHNNIRLASTPKFQLHASLHCICIFAYCSRLRLYTLDLFGSKRKTIAEQWWLRLRSHNLIWTSATTPHYRDIEKQHKNNLCRNWRFPTRNMVQWKTKAWRWEGEYYFDSILNYAVSINNFVFLPKLGFLVPPSASFQHG